MYKAMKLALIAVLVTTVVADSDDSEDITARVKEQDELFAQRWEAGDFDGVAELFTEDCVMMPPGREATIGRAAVADIIKFVYNLGVAKPSFSDVHVSPLDEEEEKAYSYGKFHRHMADGSMGLNGKFVTIWEEIDGTLYRKVYIFNFN